MFFGQIARILGAMEWNPNYTIDHALWITGGQWAGKSTVSGILSDRYGLVHYHLDYHSARGHWDRKIAAEVRRGEPPVVEPDFEQMWLGRTAAEGVESALAGFAERIPWVLDDLRGISVRQPVLVDGWDLRPRYVLPVIKDPARMVALVPTDDFRLLQASRLERAMSLRVPLSDPEQAQRNRVERDRLLALDMIRDARDRGVRVIEVDGSRNADEVADLVADHFHDYLPALAVR